MADANQQDFLGRVGRIDTSHKRKSQGYIASVNHDGLIIAVPKSESRVNRIPFKGLAMMAAAILLFKGGAHAHLGPVLFDEKIAELASGSVFGQIGAWVLHADPLTLWVSELLRPILG